MCDFEMGATCIFEPIFNQNTNWMVYPASSIIPDHTTHTSDGHYYGLDFANFTSADMNQSTPSKRQHEIISLSLNGYKYRCLKFSYLLHKVSPSTRLYYKMSSLPPGLGTSHVRKWEVAGGTSGIWFTHQVPMRKEFFDLRMGIETAGESGGKVFVDDILFSDDSCDNPHNCNFEVIIPKRDYNPIGLNFNLKQTIKTFNFLNKLYKWNLAFPHRTAMFAIWRPLCTRKINYHMKKSHL